MPIVKGPYQYTDDTGKDWTVVIDEAIGAQACFGFQEAVLGNPWLKSRDGSHRMRHAIVLASNGKAYQIPCGSNAATAYTTAGTTCTVHQSRDDTALNAVSYGYEGESVRTPKPAAPTQGA